jgi:hypothetical protein
VVSTRARCGHCSACASDRMLRQTSTTERTVTLVWRQRQQARSSDTGGAIRERHGCGNGMPVQHTGLLVRRLDRSSSSAAPLAPRHLRAGQAAAAAPAACVATCLLPRYASPVAIMAHTMRAILLARATAASLRGLRSSKVSSQAEALLLRLGETDHCRCPQHQQLPPPLVAGSTDAAQALTARLWSALSAQGRARPQSAARIGTGRGRS